MSLVNNGSGNNNIDELLSTHPREEWKQIILTEMDKLGLCFDYNMQYNKDSLFEGCDS